MKAALEAFLQSLQELSRDQLIKMLVQMKENEMSQSVILTEMRNTSTAMTKDFSKIQEAYKKLQIDFTQLQKDYQVVCEQNAQLLRKVFGRQSEKIVYMDGDTPPDDPLSEEEAEEKEKQEAERSDGQENKEPPAPPAGKPGLIVLPGGKGHTGERKPRKGMDLSKLPFNHTYLVTASQLDEMFGEGNWTIHSWHVRRKVERIPEVYYVQYTHSPVVAVGKDGKLVAIPFGEALRDYSIATASLVASIMFKKIALGIPLYRQEWDLELRDFPLSRQNMASWLIYFALTLFGPVYDWLWQELKKCPYLQNDETTLQVINDGRDAGRLSYMWVHMTSELWKGGNPIIIFAYEMTRAADHLREYFYDYVGTMVSDAYGAYFSFRKEHEDAVTLAGCLMHGRRPVALSAAIKGMAKMPEEEAKKLPEYRLLLLLAMIFDLEKSCRDFTAEERKAFRQEKIRPLLDEYFQIIHSLDPENPEYTEKMKKGIHYALAYEAELRRFLDDGNIPCDNGACERHIRPFAVGRKVWLFSNTIDGAKALAILFTLVETARANNVDPYYYLKYLLDSMPAHMDDHDRSFLADMMPWSTAYKEYEEREKAELIKRYCFNTSDEPPIKTRCRSGPQKKRATA